MGEDTVKLSWYVLTLFPEMFESVLRTSLFGKAVDNGLLSVELINYRDWAEGRHRVVDDEPFGGGAGMVIKVEPVARALEQLRRRVADVRVVLLSPQGRPFRQEDAERLSRAGRVALVCGRYEGFDERVRGLVDEEISIGDFVLAGGEAAAWVVMEATSRLVAGVLGQAESLDSESFAGEGLLEYPQYTRPREFSGQRVPEVLLGGDHAAIALWRRRQALLRTARRRPDLLARARLSDDERAWLRRQAAGETEKKH